MRNLFILLLGLMVLAGCSKTSVEPELNTVVERQKMSQIQPVADCSITLGPGTLPGTNFNTLQIHITKLLSSTLIVHFEARPKFGGSLLGSMMMMSPVTLLPGERWVKVDLFPGLPGEGSIDVDEDGNLIRDHEEADSYQVNIRSVNYNGPESIWVDSSKWSVIPHWYQFETYGFEITRIW